MADLSDKNLLLLSGSRAAGNTPDGQQPGFLDWAESWIREFFAKPGKQGRPILFVPYARPGGLSESAYFKQVCDRFRLMNLDTVQAPDGGLNEKCLREVGGLFIGGGHTPTLLHKLQSTGSIQLIKSHVEGGLPYLGSSAGTLITCPTIKTNNDMPGPANDIIDLRAVGLQPIQLNCHYMDDSMHDPKHQGETRDVRLREFCAFNPNIPVLGLYEGQALRVIGNEMELLTSFHARGTASPLFLNDTRQQIRCEPGVPERISQLF